MPIFLSSASITLKYAPWSAPKLSPMKLIAVLRSSCRFLRVASVFCMTWYRSCASFGAKPGAPGRLADLVLLDANPLADIRNTRRIHAVVLDGRLLDRGALDAQLERARRAANPAP